MPGRPLSTTTRAPIRYEVAMPEPHSHEYRVTMHVPALPERKTLELCFPAWAPGSYMVRDFVRHVYDLEITDERGRPVPSERLDKQRWRVRTNGQTLRVRYTVFAFEQTVRTSHLDEDHAYWNGTSLFFFVDGEIDRPCQLKVDAPRFWRVSTALPLVKGQRRTYRARTFDELVDSPFEVGRHQAFAFSVDGTRFEVALYGRTNADQDRLLDILKRIASATGRLFDGFPFARYLFIIHALPARGGGLEHADSTTLDIAGLAFEDEKGYQEFAELAAHEFFHAWNVKRIHDRVLGPFDYTRENHTRMLWFHEGFTEYMESLVLLRARLLTPARYLRDLADAWEKYIARPGRNVTPLSELSFEAWIKQYKPADNHTNRVVSYYDKGRWVALVLELLMRQATGGRRGIVELFRRLWDGWGKREEGITVVDVRTAAEAIAGRSLRAFFRRYVDGVDELPVPRLLRSAGVRVRSRRMWEGEEDPTRNLRLRGWSGLSFGNDRAVVRNVVPDSPAWRAGATFGDEVVAVNEQRVTAATVAKRLADVPPGEKVEISFFRQDLLRRARWICGTNPDQHWDFSLDPTPPAKALAIRRGWLRS